MTLLRRSLRFLVLFTMLTGIASAQQEPLPLGSLLAPDGSLATGGDLPEAIDPHGWRMVVGDDGEPRFLPEGAPPISAMIAGDECWQEGFGPRGLYGLVHAMSVREGDLYIAGNFRLAGPILVNNIVRYRPATREWSLLGEPDGNGTNGPIYAMTWFDGDLYVGGRFTQAGYVEANAIARWSPSSETWHPLGQGVRTPGNWPITVPYSGTVYALAASDNSIFVGGAFAEAGGRELENFARWDAVAEQWTFPCRPEAEAPNGPIYALTLRDSLLYIGGAFTQIGPVNSPNIARLNVESLDMTPLGSGLSDTVFAIGVAGDGSVFAGGSFTASGATPLQHVGRWRSTGGWSAMTGGVDATVRSLLIQGSAVIAGGAFDRAGGVVANAVARWEAGEWKALAEGIAAERSPAVFALASLEGDIIAGGRFTSAGVATVLNTARWDSLRSVWLPLDDTVTQVSNGTNGSIYAMVRRGDDIFVGGDFTTAGGIDAPRVARYNLVTERWYALGSGIAEPGAFVRALAIGGDGALYVGGIFTNAGGSAASGIARWTGSAWESVGGGVGGTTPFVFALLAGGDEIVVGGAFSTAGSVPSGKVAIWNTATSSWSSPGGGITGDTEYSLVQALARRGDTLVAGGLFHKAGGEDAEYVALFDGTSWRAMGSGTNAPVTALTFLGDTLYVGGEFTRGGSAASPHLVFWQNGIWFPHPSPLDATVRSFFPVDGDVIVSGEFGADAGGDAYVRRWDPSSRTWQRVAEDANGSVRAVSASGPDLLIAGDFTRLSGVRANHIARRLPSGWSALGSDATIGLDGPVLAIAKVDTVIYAGGRFGTTGGVRTNAIALWDGLGWRSVGGGVRADSGAEVRALAPSADGGLYVGGRFDTAGSAPAQGVALWRNGTWSALGSGLGGGDASASALATLGSDLYVGGSFLTAGSVPAVGIARWDGSSWSAVGGADGVFTGATPGHVTEAVAYNGRLYIGGTFGRIGSVDAASIARFDPSSGTWEATGLTGTDPIGAMTAGNGYLYVARSHTDTIEGPIVSTYVRSTKVWRYDGTTWTMIYQGSGHVNALAVTPDGHLYAGGNFSSLASTPASGIARWYNDRWESIGAGVLDLVVDTGSLETSSGDSAYVLGMPDVYALLPTGSAAGVWVGGSFKVAGGIASANFGRWEACGTLDAPLPPLHRPAPEFRLSAAPSPARDRVGLSFVLPVSTRGRLTLHTVGGEQVTPLHEGELTAGRHLFTADVGGLASGTYYVRLVTTEGSATATIVVTR